MTLFVVAKLEMLLFRLRARTVAVNMTELTAVKAYNQSQCRLMSDGIPKLVPCTGSLVTPPPLF